jgi:predicted enzyme related to lactoylglutathione lyase
MTYQHGLFSWTDLSAPDPAAASAFYASLFGWDAEDQHDPDGNYIYTMFSMGGKSVAGLGPQPRELTAQGVPPMWNSYVTVDNVDEALAQWSAAGGTVIMPAMDVLTSGRMAFGADPEGATIAFWQAGDHVGGEVFNAPGSMTWNELNTRDVDAAMTFYGEALGWEFEIFEGEGAPYWLVKIPNKKQGDPLSDDAYNGGMLTIGEDFPAEMPAHWSVYFASADTDAAVAKVLELGGGVVAPAMDTPAGKIAVVADPQGGAFNIITPPPPQS